MGPPGSCRPQMGPMLAPCYQGHLWCALSCSINHSLHVAIHFLVYADMHGFLFSCMSIDIAVRVYILLRKTRFNFLQRFGKKHMILAATKQLREWYFLSVCLSVCHTFLTMFPSPYHHEIFRNYSQWPCKSEVHAKGLGQRSRPKRPWPHLAVSGP